MISTNGAGIINRAKRCTMAKYDDTPRDASEVVLTRVSLKGSFNEIDKPPRPVDTTDAPIESSENRETNNSGEKTAKNTTLNANFNSPSSEHMASNASSTADTLVKDGIWGKVNIKCLVSCGLITIYVAFFGFALTYSFLHYFRGDTCDKYSKMCNMQFIGCWLIVASLVIFSANFFTHITNFKSPNIQRQYISYMKKKEDTSLIFVQAKNQKSLEHYHKYQVYRTILFMVPVLAAQSWVFMFTMPEIFIAYSFIAESYKTFSLYCVLHMFMNFLWERCEGHELLRSTIPIRHLFGLGKCFAPVKSIREFYVVSIVGALQCIIIRPVTFVVIVVLGVVYPDNDIVFYAAKGISVIQWVSQVYAIYAVLMWVRNFREKYDKLVPLVKHFGLMLFHILIPTLLPQVMDICIRYELFDLNEIFDGTDNQNLFYKVQGFIQAASGFLGTIYITWMYSSRDVKLFTDDNTPKTPVATALSHMVSSIDLSLDFHLMEARENQYDPEPDSHVNTSYVGDSVENMANMNEVEEHQTEEGIFHISAPEE